MKKRSSPKVTEGKVSAGVLAQRMYQVQEGLHEFVRARWVESFVPLLAKHFADEAEPHPNKIAAAELKLCCTHRLPGGRTVAEMYIEEGGLSEEERATLHGWSRASFLYYVCEVLGVQEVQGHPVIRAHSPDLKQVILIRPPHGQGQDSTLRIAPRSLVLNPLLPVRDFYITATAMQIIRSQDRAPLARELRAQLANASRRGEEPYLRLTSVSGPDDVVEEFLRRI